MQDYLTAKEIKAWQPYRDAPVPDARNSRLEHRLRGAGQWDDKQIASRRWAIGCVSLEITQRCNLDCTLCYLSDNSESTPDLPIAEIFRRIDMIFDHFGADADVQVSGGEPTLRKPNELLAIVRRIVEKGMRASLFTNGIRATRELLVQLAEAGLSDVAFHVDMTQQRQGYASEAALNALRVEYIERARGLPLAVFFNTTIFAGNFHEIPVIVRWFSEHADVVRLGSFQLQADTGRGVLREREALITQRSVIEQIEQGARTRLNFDAFNVGHSSCNKYAMALVIDGNLYDAYDDPDLVVPLMRHSSGVSLPRTDRNAAVRAMLGVFARAPALWWRGARYIAKKLWAARADLLRARGRVDKLTFVLHNFMDERKLEHDRLEACVFMVATGEGPLSMCLHNAKRDDYLWQPIQLHIGKGQSAAKYLRGRARQAALAARDIEPQRIEARAR